MTDNNKQKRTSSFRKLFPSLFFSHKPKEKGNNRDAQIYSKNATEKSSRNNQYQNPRQVIKKQEWDLEDGSERIYENLTIVNQSQKTNDINSSDAPSNYSSSSTLVSESGKNNTGHPSKINEVMDVRDKDYKVAYAARPQVPPKPFNESMSLSKQKSKPDSTNSQFPDVYYHSLEKLTDKISPLDEIEIYRASQAQANPRPVGAEIKKVSTKFLISPKKEAEVRTIQPTRARSLSLDKIKDRSKDKIYHVKSDTESTYESPKKSYNYSAPTSPTPIGHKIPNMPKTVSPYEHVRKTLIEAEEKRNSLKRSNIRNNFTPSPSLENYTDVSKMSTLTSQKGHVKQDCNTEKEKTRQKVEAFYWQKLKELKQKEDEYYLRQSVNSSTKSPTRHNTASYSNSNCSTPNSLIQEPRSYSLPRGKDLHSYCTNYPIYSISPFARGVPERRTDTFIKTRSSNGGPDTSIIYRNPEKLKLIGLDDRKQTPIFQRGSLTHETRNIYQQPKRVSFEEGVSNQLRNDASELQTVNVNIKAANTQLERYPNVGSKLNNGSKPHPMSPPLPPVRTTSVGTFGKSYPVANNKIITQLTAAGHPIHSESESGSEAGEIQRILQNNFRTEEDWHGDASRTDGGLSDGETSRGPSRGRSSRRDDPRRHTLAGNHLFVHPHHPGQINSLDMEQYPRGPSPMNAPEYATVIKYRVLRQNRILDPRTRKPPLPRNYPPNNAMLFDDDPGIMSEVETASTGFRRGGKQRSSLPVVRTPSKTLERPLGLVFLQYRNETKRALLPNEITSIDTVKALFVRSFPKQLTMQYMDSPMVKIYIHDSSKDMFYELEDDRAHLRDIRDRSVLRLFEATDIGGGAFPGAVGVGSVAMPPGAATCSGPSSWDQDQSYFSEPEIDSEYHHQHVHKSKVKAPAYYMGTQAPSTLPRGGSMMRAFSPAAPPVPADRIKTLPGAGHSGEGYMSSPERGAARTPYEDPYYTQFLGPAAGRTTITPVIDEEAGDGVIIDDSYQMYGVNPMTTAPRPMPRPPYDGRLNPQVDDIQRLRVEKMERQLANLTGLVQKALQVPGAAAAPPPVAPRQDFQTYQARPAAQDAARFASNERPPKLGRDKFQKSVSFEKSVSFSDDPPDMNSPKQHSPQHSADTKPTKPAIKSSTLPRTSSQERDRLKPAPPPKPAGLVGQQLTLASQRTYTITVTPDFFNQLRILQKQSRDLRIETRNLRRSTLAHAIQMRQLMADTIVKIGALAANFYEHDPESQLTREEEIYRQDMLLLENDLYELEATVERLRGQAANRETRVNMTDIERIAMVLSKSSKTVADWKLKYPILQETMKARLSSQMEKVVRKEKMLEEEPERLELALRRCKKLTGTLVTLKRLACVQEQRLPLADGRISPGSSQGSSFTAGPSSEEFNSESTCHIMQGNKRVLDSRGSPQP